MDIISLLRLLETSPWEERLRKRPGRVHFFKFYRAGRVRSRCSLVDTLGVWRLSQFCPPYENIPLDTPRTWILPQLFSAI